MSFHVGQKVCCIDGSRMRGIINTGDVFTISAVGPLSLWGNVPLEFSDGPPCPFGYSGWNSRYFRPIVSRKTDISALKALLVPGTKIRETA